MNEKIKHVPPTYSISVTFRIAKNLNITIKLVMKMSILQNLSNMINRFLRSGAGFKFNLELLNNS